jgi:hypothetical protein
MPERIVQLVAVPRDEFTLLVHLPFVNKGIRDDAIKAGLI